MYNKIHFETLDKQSLTLIKKAHLKTILKSSYKKQWKQEIKHETIENYFILFLIKTSK